jgi:hypothetical protein
MLGLEGYSLAVVLPAALALYFLANLAYTAVYNVFFHPLAHVPGPRLAGATYLYQTYHSFIGGSRYYARIKELHEVYGMTPLIGRPWSTHLFSRPARSDYTR